MSDRPSMKLTRVRRKRDYWKSKYEQLSAVMEDFHTVASYSRAKSNKETQDRLMDLEFLVPTLRSALQLEKKKTERLSKQVERMQAATKSQQETRNE